MRQLSGQDLTHARLRRNSEVRLCSYDDLDPEARRALGSLAEARDFFGVLLPPAGSALPLRAISRDAALLLFQLAEPARVPHLLGSLFGAEAPMRVRELVLDGVLEVEQDGQFVSGVSLLPDTALTESGAGTRIGELSREAIDYAVVLRGLSVQELSRRLYLYNRIPSSPAQHRKFASPRHVMSYLSASPEVVGRLRRDWVVGNGAGGWIQFRRADLSGAAHFKLYVSVLLVDLQEAFAATAEALRQVSCPAFKIGGDAFGLLRPDKLVAYFATVEDLHRAADAIHDSVAGARVQGVPFSGVIDPAGLTSWGMDPPPEPWSASLPAQSWRQWVVERLAVHIVAAKESGSSSPADHAVHRLALDGVDTETWTPSLGIWKERRDVGGAR
jgi:hypothetical protein